MRLNPPKKITFWASIALAVVGALLYFLGHFEFLAVSWFGVVGVLLLFVGYAVLALSLIIKGF
jgi:hypothetical protein